MHICLSVRFCWSLQEIGSSDRLQPGWISSKSILYKPKISPSLRLLILDKSDAGQILCAILNRVTNFTAPYGSLVYLNWYAGEASTAVIVANVPHLGPLFFRIFNIGSFKQTTAPHESNQSRIYSHTGGTGTASTRRTKHDIDGYILTGSDEKILGTNEKGTEWRYSKKLDLSEPKEENIELSDVYMTPMQGSGAVGVRNIDLENEDQRLGVLKGDPADLEKRGHIVKTIQIDQYSSESWELPAADMEGWTVPLLGRAYFKSEKKKRTEGRRFAMNLLVLRQHHFLVSANDLRLAHKNIQKVCTHGRIGAL